MNIKCCIIDDEEHAIEVLAKYIQNTPGLELAGTEINPLAGLNKISNKEIEPDITFVDIDMPQLSGLDLAGLIHHATEVVFTTAFENFAVSAFEKDAVDYILKPIRYERFLQAVNKVKEKLAAKRGLHEDAREQDHFFIQSESKGKLVKIRYDEILYIESLQNYLKIHLDNKAYLTYLTMKEIEEKLPAGKFARVHKSYIVNVEKIKSVEGNELAMGNGESVVLGTSYRKHFLGMIGEKVIRSKRAQ